jgi:hypothetical protein
MHDKPVGLVKGLAQDCWGYACLVVKDKDKHSWISSRSCNWKQKCTVLVQQDMAVSTIDTLCMNICCICNSYALIIIGNKKAFHWQLISSKLYVHEPEGYGWSLSMLRALSPQEKTLKHSLWVWFGWNLWSHQSVWLPPHQRKYGAARSKEARENTGAIALIMKGGRGFLTSHNRDNVPYIF